ncbi:MAG TPA: hypothetical protein ENI76_07760 [Ignavibacteria bacterium]|nr:hypothetical protein [Ignavibacteria bacterium]
MSKNTTSTKEWKRLQQILNSRTSISSHELMQLVKKHLEVKADYAIWLLLREKILTRPAGKKRGLYIISKNSTSQHILDPLEAIQSIYGTKVVFCYGTALYLHGLSRYGRLMHYYLLTEKKSGQKKLGQIKIRFVRSKFENKKGLTYQKKKGKDKILLTDIERTIIDCIDRTKYAQGWENIFHALLSVKRIRTDKLFKYIKELDSPILAAKLGVILEHFAKKLRISTKELISLQQYVPRTPARFGRTSTGKLNKRWNIIVPDDFFII